MESMKEILSDLMIDMASMAALKGKDSGSGTITIFS
jgi:hypothetical protein